MNVLAEPKIMEQFQIHHEEIKDEELFSDSMFILDAKFKRNRIIFVIAEQAVYLFTHTRMIFGRKKIEFLRRIPFSAINTICLSKKHFTLFALQISTNEGQNIDL